MSDPVVITEDLGGSALSRAVRSGALSPTWVPTQPRTMDEWRRRALAIGAEDPDGGWLTALRGAFSATGLAKERLERAANSGGVLVTTGQQPGPFGGPLLTLVKAISARALADAIESATGVPTAPVFWAATDDADFAEAARVWLTDGDGAREVVLASAPATGTPMASAPLSADDLGRLLPLLRAAAGSVADPTPIELVERNYTAGATVGTAYVNVLRALLAPLGIAVIDASHIEVQRASQSMLRSALRRAADVETALHARNAALLDAGFEPQVVEVQGRSLVFGNDGSGKQRIPVQGADGPGDASDVVLSPTVLLRPVVERAILPTVVYVGGPAEVAYFAQASAVATALDAAVPLAVPRWSMTIVEPRVARVLARLGVTHQELRDRDRLTARLAKTRLPEGVSTALEELKRAVEPGIARLRSADAGGLVSPRSVEGTALGIAARIARLERRYTAAVKRRETDLMRDLDVASASLFPGGVKQERRHAYVPFLARYGPTIIDQMLAGASAHAAEIVGPAAESSVEIEPNAVVR